MQALAVCSLELRMFIRKLLGAGVQLYIVLEGLVVEAVFTSFIT